MSSVDINSNDINNEIISNFQSIAGKLSLFNEDSFTNKLNDTENKKILKRPTTPLEQEIQRAPTSLQEFLQLLQRRINISKDSVLSENDLIGLLGILEKEITFLWPDLKNLIDYPLFNVHQNQELRSTIFVEIISRCRLLFYEYVEKINFYNNKNIFSDESNFVRIKLQLASDIRHKLHVPSLRRRIYQNISKDNHLKKPACCEISSMKKAEEEFHYALYDTKSRQEERMPEISTPVKKIIQENEKQIKGRKTKDFYSLDATEVTIEKNDDVMNIRKTVQELISNNRDLMELLKDKTEDDNNDCFPKMSLAMPSLKKHEEHNNDLRNKIKMLQDRNREKKQLIKYSIRPPIVNQPVTIQRSYRNKIYCVPDIRPTERRFDYEIALSGYSSIWNELADDISPETVKDLDRNLFRGEEIKHIYSEMMKTVSRDYLSYTDDPLLEDCPDKVNITDFKASRTLQNESKRECIINADLKKLSDSPWKLNSQNRIDWEFPNYALNTSSSSGPDLKQYVEMSINELMHPINLARQPNEESSSTNNSLKDNIGSLHFANETQDLNTDTFTKNITPNRNYVLTPEKFEMGISRLSKLQQDRLVKQYKEWLILWKNYFEFEDYLKFLSFLSTDFLSVIFHLYDSYKENTVEEEEEYLYPELVEERKKMNERLKERNDMIENKVQELQNKKHHYEKGLWNTSTIFIDGLGKTPKLSETEKEELLQHKPLLPDPDVRFHKTPAYSKVNRNLPSGKLMSLFTKEKSTIKITDIGKDQLLSDNEEMKLNAIQKRMEQIWNKLKMPSHMRLDMAIKYSSENKIKNIEKVLETWDDAVDVLLKRECFISQLEDFERTGSDPNRFFAKGYQGSSLARMEESKVRQNLHEKIDFWSNKVEEAMRILNSECKDDLSYEGRLYKDKMVWDRTEMLYWLQEERKEPFITGITNVY